MEIRSFTADAAPKIEGRTIQGYGAVFGQQSRVMYDPEKKRFFVEVIEPGAITEELLRSCDVKALLEHNKQRILARSFMGAGSLTLGVDNYGMAYRFDSPNTPDGDCCVEHVTRGDLFGSSFAYWTDEKRNVTYKKDADLLFRTVHRIDKIFDVSIVSDPAYFGTDVTVRCLAEFEATNNDYIIQLNNLRKFI